MHNRSFRIFPKGASALFVDGVDDVLQGQTFPWEAWGSQKSWWKRSWRSPAQLSTQSGAVASAT